MQISKFLDPKNDFAFKRIFGTERNKGILIHFLNDILGFEGPQKIQGIEFLKTNQDPDIAAKKQSLVDVLCRDEKGTQYIVEMQVVRRKGFEKRAQYYAAKAYSRQLAEGEQYHSLKEIIFLAITDFVMFPNKEAYKSDHVILDKNTYEHNLKDFSFTFIELPKFKKTLDQLSTIVEKWVYFFKNAGKTEEKDLAHIAGNDLVIQQAYEELNRFSWSEGELNTYEQEEKYERDAQAILEAAEDKGIAKGIAIGEAKGKEEGMAIGEENEKLAMAKALLSKGIPLEVIIECTGLSVQTIQSLDI